MRPKKQIAFRTFRQVESLLRRGFTLVVHSHSGEGDKKIGNQVVWLEGNTLHFLRFCDILNHKQGYSGTFARLVDKPMRDNCQASVLALYSTPNCAVSHIEDSCRDLVSRPQLEAFCMEPYAPRKLVTA